MDVARWFRVREPILSEDPEAEPLFNPKDWTQGSGPKGFEFAVVRGSLFGSKPRWVIVARVPTGTPFEAPAYLRFGGWNSCPESHAHVAIWKRWEATYGAKILCMSGDIVEATVERPPLGKDECYALAREQFAYCPDIVTQGVGTIDALASLLSGGRSWYFWWD